MDLSAVFVGSLVDRFCGLDLPRCLVALSLDLCAFFRGPLWIFICVDLLICFFSFFKTKKTRANALLDCCGFLCESYLFLFFSACLVP